MALSATRLRTAIVTALESVQTGMTTDQITQLNNAWQAVATAIVNEITGNAVVNPGTLANPSGQPVATTGSATAQTGTTTAPKTITGAGTIS